MPICENMDIKVLQNQRPLKLSLSLICDSIPSGDWAFYSVTVTFSTAVIIV